MQTIKLGLIGNAGRMGQALTEYVQRIPDIELIAAIDARDSLDTILTHNCNVIVDLSVGPAVDTNGPLVVKAGFPYVVGATGYSTLAVEIMKAESQANATAVLLVPNFSLGANLMIKFAAEAAKIMHSPVITERHHERKADAPSGTAQYTAQRICEALTAEKPELPSTRNQFSEQLMGVLGGVVDDVAIHSIRGEGFLAEQTVQFCLPGESLTIEHRSIDRRCFMPGIEYAIRNIHRVNGLQIGLDSIM